MRKTKLSAAEIAEIDAFNKGEHRKNGFSLMKIRDRGWAELTPHYSSAAQVYLDWSKSKDYRGLVKFQIDRNGERFDVILDSEELLKYLRWA